MYFRYSRIAPVTIGNYGMLIPENKDPLNHVPWLKCVFLCVSSGPGIQWAESGGDHRRGVCGRPDHAALHGVGTANLEEVDIYIYIYNQANI